VLQCVAVCCSVLQCIAVCCRVLQCVTVCCSGLQCIAECCNALRCVLLCCSVRKRSSVSQLIHMCVFCFAGEERIELQVRGQGSLLVLFLLVLCLVRPCVEVSRGWRRPLGCPILIGHFLQKSPIISGSFSERDLQHKASYASSTLCIW